MISLTSPVRTRAHGWPAGPKLVGLCAATLVLLLVPSLPVQAAALAATLGLYAAGGRVFLREGLRRLRPLWPFLLIVGAFHLWSGRTTEGAVIVLRLVTAVGLANLVTMTTRLGDMIEVVHRVTAPLRRLGVSTKPLEIAIGLVIRMVPALLARGRQLGEAWRARSPRRVTWRIVLPFALTALDDADRVAEALRARGGLTPPPEREV